MSLNLWRGRDHGLPGYNTYRRICGLPPVTNFQELLTIMDRPFVDRLAKVYRSVDDIDLFIGGLVEQHLPGSMLGPVFSCIIADQFARLKEGDRFFYEHGGHPNSFTPGIHFLNHRAFKNKMEFKTKFYLCSTIARNSSNEFGRCYLR